MKEQERKRRRLRVASEDNGTATGYLISYLPFAIWIIYISVEPLSILFLLLLLDFIKIYFKK